MHINPQDLHEFLRARRSIRRFKPNPVPDSILHEVLQTAIHAPSAHNRQPWRMAVLMKDPEKSRLCNAMTADFAKDLEGDGIDKDEIQRRIQRSRRQIMSAPIAIVQCLDMSEMNSYADEKRSRAEYLTAVQSVANAGLQLLLAAHAEGLGGVWICSPIFTQETVKGTLNLPAAWEPQALFLLGYPAENPPRRPGKPLNQIVKFLDETRTGDHS